MPTSEINTVPAIITEVCRLQPKSVLDLGCGNCKYPVLIREYLDGAYNRIKYDDWTVKIDAVEGFRSYVNDLHYSVCNNVYIEDFSAGLYGGYDLVLMIDSFEHLDREVGQNLMDGLLKRNKHVIVSVPYGFAYRQQGAEFGNEFERHRTRWEPNYFKSLGGTEIFRGVCVAYSIPGRK